MSSYAMSGLDEIEELDDGRCPFRPVRHHFGITAFGATAWTGKAAGDRIINEHDEGDDGHQELYFVHTGRATFELDGERVEAPAGSFVYVPPGVKRTALAEEAGTTVLVVGAAPGEAYVADGWEAWAPLRPAYEAGDYDTVIEGLSAAIGLSPSPNALFNLACVESLAGRKEDALGHLRQAVEMSDRCRELAKQDSDFDAIRDEPEFAEIVGG
jgi:mannose-6-phosphate isomerase-like protein (cupin superfamily)